MPAELALDVAALALYDVVIMAGMPSRTSRRANQSARHRLIYGPSHCCAAQPVVWGIVMVHWCASFALGISFRRPGEGGASVVMHVQVFSLVLVHSQMTAQA